MTGVFDSGVGGLAALAALRLRSPEADLVYLADRENAPYGTKGESELVELVTNDIRVLRDFGADTVLMACCTASTVHGLLPEWARKIARPIIRPTAEAALRVTKNGKIGIIATKRTVASHAFRRELFAVDCIELETQGIVSLVEGGARDGHITDGEGEALRALLSPLIGSGIDTLVLGCTHFSHLKGEIGRCFENVNLVDSAEEGAESVVNKTKKAHGRTVYL